MNRIVTAGFATLAVLFAVGTVWLLWVADDQAEGARLEYGRNVDSGAIPQMVAVVLFLPTTVLLAVAAVATGRGWRGRWIIQALALLYPLGVYWALG